MRVLYLSEWYPHRYDAMSGLFVRKHAEAAAGQGADICVLFLYKDKRARVREIVEQTTNGVREVYVYYRRNYLAALRAGWHYVRTHWGMPDLCQLNVITKNALLPLYLQHRYRIPYIIVEHWSGYLPQNGAYERGSWLHRRLATLTVHRAAALLPVSQVLEDNMRRLGLTHPRTLRVHNVVDDFFYDRPLSPRRDEHRRLLHVSCFDEQAKNICGILRAMKSLCAVRTDVTLVIVGAGVDYPRVRAYADTLHLPEGVLLWKGELTPQQVAAEFDHADLFVLFSNYENAPVVISESLATGTPIVSSAVGGIAEMVDAQTGELVPARDEQALAAAIQKVLDNPDSYNRDTLRERGRIYSRNEVGAMLMDLYRSCIRSSH